MSPSAPGDRSLPSVPPVRVYIAFRDTPERRAALEGRAPPWLCDPYARLPRYGAALSHNLETPRRPRWSAWSAAFDAAWIRRFGVGPGDWERAWTHRRAANAADIIIATADPAGLPLAALRRWGRLRPPLIYVSIGLPERLERLKPHPRIERLFRRWLDSVSVVVAFGWAEAEWLRRRLPRPVVFLPYGVDPDLFSPMPAIPAVDVLSIGADPQRDIALLRAVAERLPHRRFCWIAPRAQWEAMGEPPPNLAMQPAIPPAQVRAAYATARVLALPVKENSYSGATTTLLQAMAMAKPVVVSRVGAIAEGYGFRNGEHLCAIAPGNADAFADAVEHLLSRPADAEAMGRRAREHVRTHLTMDRLARQFMELVYRIHSGTSMAAPTAVSRP